MRKLFLQAAAVLCTAVWLPLPGYSQGHELAVWTIQIQDPATVNIDEYSVDLEDLSHHKVATGNPRAGNYFDFRNIPAGDYFVTVSDPQGRTVYRGPVTVQQGVWEDIIDLGESHKASHPPGGPISVTQLQHPPSRKALAASAEAQKLARDRQYAAAAEQLEKAIRISPDYAGAHTNLAAQYIRLGRFEEALTECRRAIGISGPNAMDLGNMALAQAFLHRREQAIESAQAGLKIEPDSAHLHYILGRLLAMDRRTLPAALPHLELAARTMESARTTLEAVRQALR